MLKPGMFISDRYEIIDKVGSGGMADVYKARCHRLNRFVAIKVLKQEYSEDKKFVAKFRGEAQSAAGLSHPNIVNVYDVGEDDGLYYIVMELVEGITLKSFIARKGHLDVKEAIGISIQMAQGMEAAHGNHIVHRDIKPQNIIISREGKVKVTDFGIARAASSNTITSNAMGSVHYISPEQARGGYSDERSDIYSLGVTMYEMLTGKVPFGGDNTVSVALQHIQEEPVPLRDLDPQIPPSLERIVSKCMQKKPERRYESATELIADLKKAITNPSGDFVKIAPAVVNDSPTINISDDEVSHIKSASRVNSRRVAPEERDEEDPDEDGEEASGEDEPEIDPKLEKIIIGCSIAAGVILVALIVFLVFKIFWGGKKAPEITPTPTATVEQTEEPSPTPSAEPEEIQVPQLVGYTKEEAAEKLGDSFEPVFKEEESDMEEGTVIDQDPKGGEMAVSGSAVNITVSSGPGTVPLIDVYNLSQASAESQLIAAKYKVIYGGEKASDTIAAGNVVETDPAKGAPVREGDTITIFISKGPEKKYTKVPSLSDMTEKQAGEALKKANLTLGSVDYKNSDTAEGLVIYQSYTYNTEVEEGTSVDITISLGPKEVTPTYKYVPTDTVIIGTNPFGSQDDDTVGQVTIRLVQDGKKKTIYDQATLASEFPLELPEFEGYSESDGKLIMYLDGEEYGEVATVHFEKVAQ